MKGLCDKQTSDLSAKTNNPLTLSADPRSSSLTCPNTKDMNWHIHPVPVWIKRVWQGQYTEASFPQIFLPSPQSRLSAVSTAQVQLSAHRQTVRVIRWDGPSKLDQSPSDPSAGLSTRTGNNDTPWMRLQHGKAEQSVTFGDVVSVHTVHTHE